MSDSLGFDLTVQYPDFLLKAAGDIPAQGITVLSGPSGSGKSTLLRALAGLEPRAIGTVRLGEDDLSALRPAARNVGYVFQDARLFSHMDVEGNLNYGARRRGMSAQKVAAIIDALDLGPLLHRNPETLSGGETRRVALGRALASGPRVLLLDEPLAGLDRARKADLMPYIARAVAGFGGPAIYVTHSAYEISVLADRVLSIDAGCLTGWSGAAPRLTVQVQQVQDGWIQVVIGDQNAWIPGQAKQGEHLMLPLGGSTLISENAPGKSTGALTLSGHLISVLETEITIDIAGQRLRLPGGAQTASNWVPGQAIWLTLPQAIGPLLAKNDSDKGSGVNH